MSLPIVLLHGFPFDGGMWEGQVAYLQARGHEVLAPDLAGFGVAPQVAAPMPEEASIEAYAESVHDLILLHGGRAIVGGFSMGGYVLLALMRAYPEAVAGAMFISTRADADAPEARANRIKSIAEVRAGGTAGLVETMIGRLLGAQATPEIKAQMRTLMGRQSAAAVMAAQSAMARRRAQTDFLPRISVPALIVAGQEDGVSPPAVARGMQALIPRCRLVEIPGVGHMTPLEAPGELGAAMGDFCSLVG